MKKGIQASLIVFVILGVIASIFFSTGAVQAKPNAQATETGTPTSTSTSTGTATEQATAEATGTATETSEATGTDTATETSEATETATTEATAEATGTDTATETSEATAEATETTTAEATGTGTAEATETATAEATVTSTSEATAEATSTALPTTPATATGTAAATAAATTVPAAPTTPAAVQGDTAAQAYCEQVGGTVTTRRPAWNTNAPQAQWLMLAGSRDFCTFLSEPDSTGFQSHIEIAVDTLYAQEPSLAVLAYMEPVALPPFTGANPSTLYCSKLGGTDIFGGANSAAGGGWVTEAPDSATNFQIVSQCMFPDGSAIDSWGLTYKANGVIRGTDLSEVVRYQPSALPAVFGGGSNQPAPHTVDHMLTEADNGNPVTLNVGDTLTVQLASNPSTGYSWKVIENDTAILEQVGEAHFDLGNQTPMPGAGGTETFTFRAKAAGTTTLTLLYARPWETDTTPTPQNTWTAQVTVQ